MGAARAGRRTQSVFSLAARREADRPETPQTMTLVATEFMRRFLLHVLDRRN
jgi:hypothetical protein